MKYTVTHSTRYSYEQPVSLCHNLACLHPRVTPWQRCTRHKRTLVPQPTNSRVVHDYFGNSLLWFCFQQGYQKLHVKSVSQVEITPPTLPDVEQTTPWEEVRDQVRHPSSAIELEASQFCFESPRVRSRPEFRFYAAESFTPRRPILAALQELTTRINTDFKFDSKATTVTTPVEEVFERRRGVCQDFTHLQLSMLRSLGLSTRYVSGYIRTFPAEGETGLRGADASHAWLSLYCGSLGWIDTDPTNDQFLSDSHITVAWGRDYTDVAPLRGVFIGGGNSRLEIEVKVVPDEAE